MRKLNYVLFIAVVFYSNIFAQKVLEKNKVVFYETYNKLDEIDKIKTRNITYKAGEAVFIVLNIEASIPNEDFLAKREQEELKNNFGIKTDFINYTSTIKFYNRFQTALKFSYEDSPKKVIYWSGKMDDRPIVYDGLLKSSEYFSQYLNQNKHSSYVELFQKTLDSFTKDFIDNPTEKSILISNHVAHKMAIQILYNLREESNFFEMNFKNIKRISYKTNFEIDVDRLKEVFFDRDGKLIKIVFDDLSDKNYYYQSTLQYEDNILRKIISESTNDYYSEVPVFYKDNELYSYDQYSIKRYRTDENNFLLSDDYFYDNEKFYFLVNQVTLKNNNLRFIENDHMNDRVYNFKSFTNYFPVKIKIREDIEKELKKINAKRYKESSLSSEIAYHFNDNNLIEKIVYTDKKNPNEEKIIQYVYEFYE